MNLPSLEFRGTAEWLALYDEDCDRVRRRYCALVSRFMFADDRQTAFDTLEGMREAEAAWVRLLDLRRVADRLRGILPTTLQIEGWKTYHKGA